MESKIRNYIYHNDANYTSYDSLKCLFVYVFLFMSLVTGIFTIVTDLWWGLCILVVLDTSFLLYLIILRKIKKSYSLRFLSESIVDTLLSLLFLSSALILLFSAGYNSSGLVYGTLISYTLFTILILVYTICCAKSNSLQLAQNAEPKKHLLLWGGLIPLSGVTGMAIAKVIFKTIEFGNQVVVYICYAIFMIISSFFAFGNSNYIKYYYCKKYKIMCDKNGNTTSPNLEPTKKLKRIKTKKRIPLAIKILIGILGMPITFFLIVFLILFIKTLYRA